MLILHDQPSISIPKPDIFAHILDMDPRGAYLQVLLKMDAVLSDFGHENRSRDNGPETNDQRPKTTDHRLGQKAES